MTTADPKPVTEARCFRLATHYLTRRAASKHQLRRYLARKLRPIRPENDDGDGPVDPGPIIEAVLERLVEMQLLDDNALARTRARTLAERGFSERRLKQRLGFQGFDLKDPALSDAVTVIDDAQIERFAERKRLGPFASDPRRTSLERDVRILVRAGFAVDLALRTMRRLRADMPPEPTEAGNEAGGD